jgi:cytochrome P450
MNDGARHGPLKQAITATLASLADDRAQAASRAWARSLADELAPLTDPGRITEYASRLTAQTVASLIGAPPDVVPQAARWTGDFVRSIAPGSAPADVERGKAAAGHLLDLGRSLMTASAADSLLASLARHAEGQDAEAVIANALGFLSQAFEATTGLIGNALVALSRHADTRRAVLAEPALLPGMLGEVLRHDAPVQNTRRFVAEDAVVAGVAMKGGDAILVVLAAANRDPAVNPDPARFDITRATPRLFTFGSGVHACPGTALATTIAAAGVAVLMASVPLERLAEPVTYRPSGNIRIPVFG